MPRVGPGHHCRHELLCQALPVPRLVQIQAANLHRQLRANADRRRPPAQLGKGDQFTSVFGDQSQKVWIPDFLQLHRGTEAAGAVLVHVMRRTAVREG
jgi:hypothetical protein